MEAITLNVNAQDLINTAELFGESGNRIANVTGEMMSLITNLSGVWTGSTSEYYISKFSATWKRWRRTTSAQKSTARTCPTFSAPM